MPDTEFFHDRVTYHTKTSPLICSSHQNWKLEFSNFQTGIFLNEFSLWHIRLNIYLWKTKFSSHKEYLIDLLFCRNATQTHADQSIPQKFLLVHIIDPTCFNECFLFHVITGRPKTKLLLLKKTYLIRTYFTLSVCEQFIFLFINGIFKTLIAQKLPRYVFLIKSFLQMCLY